MKILTLVLFLAACGGDSSSVDAGATHDSPSNHDGTPSTDAPGSDAALADAAVSDAPAGPVLKLKNYLAWCTVAIDGHATSAASEQDVPVTAGTITMVASPASAAFELGTAPWHHTSGDTGNGEAGSVVGSGVTAKSTATVVVGASGKCVWICCPFTDGSGCPAVDQCP